MPFGRRSPALMAGYVIASLLAPLLFVLRFALLAPLSWIVPPLRRFVVAARIRARHQPSLRQTGADSAGRPRPGGRGVRAVLDIGRTVAGPAACRLPFCSAGPASARVASGVNAARTLAAHRYDHDEQASAELSMNEQLLDSCTIATIRRPPVSVRIANAGRALVAPVGLRYHALHHWIPSLPYHNLGRAHRLLVSALSPDAPYGATIERGFTPRFAIWYTAPDHDRGAADDGPCLDRGPAAHRHLRPLRSRPPRRRQHAHSRAGRRAAAARPRGQRVRRLVGAA